MYKLSITRLDKISRYTQFEASGKPIIDLEILLNNITGKTSGKLNGFSDISDECYFTDFILNT